MKINERDNLYDDKEKKAAEDRLKVWKKSLLMKNNISKES